MVIIQIQIVCELESVCDREERDCDSARGEEERKPVAEDDMSS